MANILSSANVMLSKDVFTFDQKLLIRNTLLLS